MNRFSIVRILVVGFVMLFLAASVSYAQTASVSGTTTDQTGAAVPDVKVTARNTETNSTKSAQTGDTGFYRISALVPAIYEIVFEKSGFRTLRYSNVVLTVDQSLTLDVKIEVSAVAESVEVSGQTVAPIELENAQISNVVDARRISDLPLIVRDPYQLLLLSPGTIVSSTRLGGFAVNGQSEKHNNFLLDGVDNNDTDVPGIPGGLTSLNPDATQEFRVISNNFLPEFGRNSGAIVDVITKSGTNNLHGVAYWFGRYDAFGARDFFNHNPDANDPTKEEAKAPYTRNDFGASLGGPLVKDKTFWFGNYEGQRFQTTLINASTVPTAAFKSGLFTFRGQTVDVRTRTSPNNNSGADFGPGFGVLFPGGLALDTTTIQKILALYPNPNGADVEPGVRGIFHFPSASITNTDNFTIKVDHNFTRNEVLSVRYSFNRFKDPNPFHSDFLPGLDAIATYQRTQNVSLGLTSTLSPTLVNELHVGGNRTNLQFNCGGTSTFNSFGAKDAVGRGTDFNLPGLSGFGCFSLGDSDGQARFTGTYTYRDTLTKVAGRHTIKGGFEFRPVYSNSFDNFFARQDLAFADRSIFGIRSLKGVTGATRTLNDMVWMLFGTVSDQSQNQFFDKAGNRQADDLRGFRQREYGLFFQDSIKLKPNFTLNLGLRWEYFGVPYEVNGNFSNLFADPSGRAPFTFTILNPGKGGTQLYNSNWKDFEPRVGFAWDPFKKGKTSIRGGYGIFHDRIFGNLFGNARSSPPFQQGFDNGILDILPNVSPEPTKTTSATVQQGDLQSFPIIFDANFKVPLVQAWNFGVQHEVFRNVTVEINYVGQHATRLFRDVDGNPPQPALVAALLAAGVSAEDASGVCLRLPQPDNCGFPSDAVNNTAFFEPLVQKSIASSIYHGLQAKVTKRFSHGLQIQGAYTWSHAIDNASDPIDPTSGNRGLPRNSFNFGPERGNSDFDVRQRLVINYIYEFPLGRGRGHLSSGFLGRILEGWQVAGITIFSGGVPFDIFGNRDNQHTALSDRADIVGNPAIPAGSDKTQTGPPVTAFALAPFGRAANLNRNQFFGPGINNFDVVMAKTTSITERLKVDLRFEFYNLFNRVQFGQPGNSIVNTGTFGISTSQVGRPDGTSGARQVQFAAKIHF